MERKQFLVLIGVVIIAGFGGGWLAGRGHVALRQTGYGPETFRAMYIETEMLGIVDPEGNRVAFLSYDGMPGNRGVYMEFGQRGRNSMIRLDAGGTSAPQVALSRPPDGPKLTLCPMAGFFINGYGGAGEDGFSLMTNGEGKVELLGLPPGRKQKGQ